MGRSALRSKVGRAVPERGEKVKSGRVGKRNSSRDVLVKQDRQKNEVQNGSNLLQGPKPYEFMSKSSKRRLKKKLKNEQENEEFVESLETALPTQKDLNEAAEEKKSASLRVTSNKKRQQVVLNEIKRQEEIASLQDFRENPFSLLKDHIQQRLSHDIGQNR